METCSTLRGQRITTCALRVKRHLKGGAEAPVLQEAPPIKTLIIPRGERLFVTFSPSGDNLNIDVATFPMELVIVGNSVSLRFSGPTGLFQGIAELETRFIGDIPPGSGLEGKIAALAATVPDDGSVIPDQYLPL